LVQRLRLFVELKTLKADGSQGLFVDAGASGALSCPNSVYCLRHYNYSTPWRLHLAPEAGLMTKGGRPPTVPGRRAIHIDKTV
jgi:hypothetical protein